MLIIYLPIKILKFGKLFNKPIDNLTLSLQKLHFHEDSKFDQQWTIYPRFYSKSVLGLDSPTSVVAVRLTPHFNILTLPGFVLSEYKHIFLKI